MADDDFHFDFVEEDGAPEDPLAIVVLNERYYMGHLVDDDNHNTWLIGSHRLHFTDAEPLLFEVPFFMIEDENNISYVVNSDHVRMLNSNKTLNVGHINGTVFLCNSTRH